MTPLRPPLGAQLFLAAKHLLFAAIRLMALIKIADLIALALRRARMGGYVTIPEGERNR